MGQPVELRIAHRVSEEYVPPPPGPFAGQGNRLGSPAPGPSTSQPTPGSSTSPPAAVPSSSSGPTAFQVDLDRPTTSIQIRLADGTRYLRAFSMFDRGPPLTCVIVGWCAECTWITLSQMFATLSMRT